MPSTSKDKLWKEWETGTIYKDVWTQEMHEFSNWINEMQIKLIDKDGNQCISNEVKRRKLLNNLPPYMEETLMPQIKDDWTYEDIVEKAESYEAAKRGRNPSGSTNGSRTKDRTQPTP